MSDSRETWLKIWKKYAKQKETRWDYLHELIYGFISSILNLKNKIILETGSGTGEVTLRLGLEGATAILLDISPNPFQNIPNHYAHSKKHFMVGDIFYLPFRDGSMDVVWSSGVLEHYTLNRAEEQLIESRRLLRKKGILIAFVPNRDAFIYNLFRIWEMKTGRWSVGFEEPWSSDDLYQLSMPPFMHWSAGFFHQFRFISIPKLSRIIRKIVPRLSLLFDKKIPTGYLLAGIWKV